MAGVQTPQIQLPKAKSQDGPITMKMTQIPMILIQRASLGSAVVTSTRPAEIEEIDLNEVVRIPESASIAIKQAISRVSVLKKPVRTVNNLVPKVASTAVKRVTCLVIALRKENSNHLDPEMVTRVTDLPGVALNVERKVICQGNVQKVIVIIGVLHDVITEIVMTLKMETIVEEVVLSLIEMVAEAIIGMTEEGMEISREKKGQGMKEGTDQGIGMILMGTDQRVVLSVAKMVILLGSAHQVEVIQEMAPEVIEMKEETVVAGQMTQAPAPAGEQVMYET